MIQKIRDSRFARVVSICLAQLMIAELFIFPVHSFSQAGPRQTETSGISLGSTGGMVDDFTGDFNYSIPLMDIDGFPITINYNSNVSMYQEASWVGLGWDLNLGSVSRDMRGVPDDFNGTDKLTREIGMNDYKVDDGRKNGGAVSISAGVGEIKSVPIDAGIGFSLLYGTYTNSYNGRGVTWDFGADVTASAGANITDKVKFNLGLNAGLGFSMDSQNGAGRNANTSVSASYKAIDMSFGVSRQFSSREGLKSKTFQYELGASSKSLGDKDNQFVYGFSASTSSTYSLGTLTSVPRFDLTRNGVNNSKTFVVKGILQTGFILEASYINTKYSYKDVADDNKKIVESAAYGYFHLGKGQNASPSERPVMDFNREREVEFSENMVNLPFSAPTYDMFHVSALGMGVQFRGFRQDIGTFHDAKVNISNNGTHVTNEVRAGWRVDISGIILGYKYSDGDANSSGHSGEWRTGNNNYLKWSDQIKNGTETNVMFKAVGEQTPNDITQLNATGGKTPYRLKVEAIDKSIIGGTQFQNEQGNTFDVDDLATVNSIQKNTIRANYIKPYTAALYSKPITYKNENNWQSNNNTTINRVGSIRKGHHISAIETVSKDGLNYYFEVPVYNVKHADVIFNATGLKGSIFESTGHVLYSGNDNTVNNGRGKNHFFEKMTVPAYAHSYLLSLMTSSDYMDRTGDGPSVDDFGEYYKINYSRIYTDVAPYKWRFPYDENHAKLIEGHRSTPFDDVATYTYGEKEICYVHSVETKNHVVEFHLNNVNEKRKDGFGVKGENGGLNENQPLRRLEKIVLYNRNDRMKKGENAVPLKTVYLEYNYSLCKGNPSNIETYGGDFQESGKLTLRAIRFSGGNSDEALLAPYEFNYVDGGSFDNPNFDYMAVDRWGNYKKNDTWRNNIDYPYATQSEEWANRFCQAWKLKQIHTPSNGNIKIEYEADRYAYTQNKRVMSMVQILGFANVDDFEDEDEDVDEPTNNFISDSRKKCNSVLFFKLDESINLNSPTLSVDILNKYFKDENNKLLTEILFQTQVKINPKFESSYENIIGFAEIITTKVGVHTFASGEKVGYVYLKKVDIKDREGSTGYMVNPMQKAAWQYARLNIPDVIYGNCDFNATSPSPADCDYDTNIDAAVVFGMNLNKKLNKEEYCRYINTDRSYIRLFDPRGYKFGGNARVKSITYSDNWNQMSSEEETSSYKWHYAYDDVRGGVYNGVANYEPALGNIVNPFYKWEAYKNEIKQFPDESLFNIEPIGELLFPTSVVGYKEVSIHFTSIDNLTANTVGKSITRFFTSFDAGKQTEVKRTLIDNSAKVYKHNMYSSHELVGLSQGYVIVTNDFHGKVKETELLDALGNSIQKSKYHYNKNNNVVTTLDEKGVLRNETIGVDYDIYADTREVENTAAFLSFGVGLQVTWFFPYFTLPPPLIYKPLGGFSYTTSKTGFYAHTLNKHINYSAILERVETTYLGSANSAENLVRDRYSGEVIVSSLNDEFNDKLYSISYPAHWYYSNLENKYMNDELDIANIVINQGQINLPSSGSSNNLVVGDVLTIQSGTEITKGWVLTKENTSYIINEQGQKFNTSSGNYSIRMHTSGRKNRINETMMQVTTKLNPIQNSTFIFPTTDVISASAIVYNSNFNISCFKPHHKGLIDTPTTFQVYPNSIINPFTKGLYNNLYMTRQFAFQEERELPAQGIRFDGKLSNYTPFYQLNNEKWMKIDDENHPSYTSIGEYGKWRLLQEITSFDEYARSLEAKDPLDVHATVLYGFNAKNKLLPIAQAINAENNQIAFESFEDLDYLIGEGVEVKSYNHLDFMERSPEGVSITKQHRHSGLSSLEVGPSKFASVRRYITLPNCSSEHRSGEDRVTNGNYHVSTCDCLSEFSPSPGKYVVSAWVKEEQANYTYSNAKITVELLNNSANVVESIDLTPIGVTIDGWQRVEGVFEVGQESNSFVQFTLSNEASNQKAYFDDFRVQPFNSEMSTTVYNPINLLPMATHDGQNYTTFYNYDENNQLVRIRIETVEGIKTISETSTGIRKRDTAN